MSIIKQNVSRIMNLVASSCNQVHRLSTEVCPIVVTKNRTACEVQEMYDLGFRHFAENRVEKLLERQNAFPQEDIIWHLIGPLQKRKVKQIVNQIQYFHAIDRLSIMEEIDKRLDSPLKCFLEVNVSGEESKHGFTISEVFEAYEVAKQYPNIEIIGLMTMAPFEANDEAIRYYFRELKEVSKKIQSTSTLKLSMGMSQDYPIAIEEGAHFIRIGTAWFE
mgnify:CR=1 FL=1